MKIVSGTGGMLAVLLLAGTAAGQTVYWNGGADSAWSNPANWANAAGGTAVKPGPGVNVVVDLRAKPKNLPVLDLANGPETVASLSISGGAGPATLTVANGDARTRIFFVTGDVTIGPKGVLTHVAEKATGSIVGNESNRLCLVIGGNLTIAAGGQINVDGKGYAGNCGPGRGIGQNSGGGHGGEGGGTAPGGTTYGSIAHPVNSGSGGYAAHYSGGGTVAMRVGGTFTHNGVITANGQNRSGPIGGAGAGGSINVTAGAMAGSGAISANGGAGARNNGTGAGGGGRIALGVTQAGATIPASLRANATACGGQGDGGGGTYGAAGTLYLKTAGQAHGDLIVNNAGVKATAYTLLHDGTNRFDSITTMNQGVLLVGANAALTMDGCALRGDSTTAGIGSRLIVQDNGRLNWTGTWINNGCISWRGTNRASGLSVGSLVIATNGTLTHETTERPYNCLMLSVNGNLTVDAGGAIWAKGLGYAPDQPFSGSGNAGGAHGGEGGWGGNGNPGIPTTPTYGSITNPVMAGGGSAGAYPSTGGGVVIVRASGTVTVNGVINAGGDTVQVSGGAGGSVNIRAGQLQGAGSIMADGGEGRGGNTGGGGGGGRIAVALTNATTFGDVAISAAGGMNLVEGASGGGAAGTIYLQGARSPNGLLIVSNGVPVARAANIKTLISSLMTDAAAGDVRVLGTAALAVDAGKVLEVYGNWSNAVPEMTVAGNGAVEFKGSAASTISGSTTFRDLKCVAPGKTLQFEGGTTQSVSGCLTLAGAEGNPLTLKSAAPPARWKLNALPGSTHDVRRVRIADGDAVALDPIIAFDSEIASGNSDNWASGFTTNVWTGSRGMAWDARENWSLGRLPTSADTVVISEGRNGPILNSDREVGGLILNTGGTLDMASRTLAVRRDMRLAGKILGRGNLRLTGAVAQSVALGGNAFDSVEVGGGGKATFTDGFTAARFACRVPGTELVFNSGSVVMIGMLELLGALKQPIRIRSSAPPAVAKWKLTGHAVVGYTDVADQDASGGNRICPMDSTGNGHTPNWNFAPAHCRGGVETEKFIGDLKYRIHMFTNSGTLKVNRSVEAEYLIVAGGGGGGNHHQGGGGGAGGFLESKIRLTNGALSVVVGAGGKASGSGGNSSISGVAVAIGGGCGGTENHRPNVGGSGGGGCHGPGMRGAEGTPGQGNAGGDGGQTSGGGGGGAGGIGKPAGEYAGGPGRVSGVTGEEVTYAAGGAGRNRRESGKGKAGGANTGNGGGGCTWTDVAGEGGSGIVVVRYKLDIHNRPVSNVTTNGATFNAYLARADPAPARVSVLWGENNGVASGGWSHTNSWKAGEWGAASSPSAKLMLAPDRNYCYTFEVVCGPNRSEADAPVSFITGAVEVRVTRRESSEEKPAFFVISRPATATNGPLAVYYTLGGTGVNGTDYEPLESPAVIPAGAAEIRLPVVPNFNMGATQLKGVELTLAPGGYLIGPNSKASMVTKPQ